jgi:hypothetical protein
MYFLSIYIYIYIKGREAKIEKRKMVGAKMHAASKGKDDSMVGLSDDFLIGTDDGLKREAKERERRFQMKREAIEKEKREKGERLVAEENSKMEAFRNNLGIDLSQKIVIKKRE